MTFLPKMKANALSFLPRKVAKFFGRLLFHESPLALSRSFDERSRRRRWRLP